MASWAGVSNAGFGDDDGRHQQDSDTELLYDRNESHLDNVLVRNQSTDSTQAPRRRRITYEDAVLHAGFGRFHLRLLLVCGWALCSNAIDTLNVIFVLPIATCEMGLMDDQQNWFIIIVYFGMILGGLLLSSLADWRGRRIILISSLTISGLFSLALSLAQNPAGFLTFRFFSGIGLGASLPVVFAYFAEFQPIQKRGTMLACLSMFWVIGAILISGLAWMMLPYSFGVERVNFHYNSWHIFLSICCIPSLTSALLFLVLPESPRYLMESGRDNEAYEVFQSIFATNNPLSLPSIFENNVSRLVWSVDHMNSVVDSGRVTTIGKTLSESVSSFFCLYKKIFQSWIDLFGSFLRRGMLIMCTIFFAVSFGYYGFDQWFRKTFYMFKHATKDGGTMCMPTNYTGSSGSGSHCYPADGFFEDKLLVYVFCLPGCLLTIGCLEPVGRRILLALGLILPVVSIFFLFFVSRSLEALVIVCLFKGLSVIGWTVLNVLSVELFPTTKRCTAFGLLSTFSVVASICGVVAFDTMVPVSCAVPMAIVAVLFFGSGALGFLLPDSRQLDLL